MSKPFLKWAGGKFTQLSDLFQHIPSGLRLIEPFVGGGSVFLNSDRHANFLLADVNPDLINLYQMLTVVPDTVESSARWMFEQMGTPENYELIRQEFNGQTLDAAERAAAFLHLNRHCFNGLMRYNLSHQFNVGWGKYKAPYFPEKELKSFTDMAHNCVFMTASFRRTIGLAGKGMLFTAIHHTNRYREPAASPLTQLVDLPGITRLSWWSAVSRPINVAQASLSQTL